MNQKHKQNVYHENVNVNLMEENVIQINGGIMVMSIECKQSHKRDYVWNPATCNCESRKYLACIMDDSAITCDEIIESYDEETNIIEKKATCKMQNFYILLTFSLITIRLLIVVSITVI